jgi:hypothetical protein
MMVTCPATVQLTALRFGVKLVSKYTDWAGFAGSIGPQCYQFATKSNRAGIGLTRGGTARTFSSRCAGGNSVSPCRVRMA